MRAVYAILALSAIVGCDSLPSAPTAADEDSWTELSKTLSTGSTELTHKEADGSSSKRPVKISVPDGSGPFPVLIVIHGRGGSGEQFIINGKPFEKTHIVVAPTGPDNSWNIVAEASTLDDVGFLGKTLIDYLAEHSNVEPVFKLFGHSNGAAMINRLLIENDDARITTAVTSVSQLNTQQWHDGNFYMGGADNAYSTVKQSLTHRRLLQMTGGADKLIPSNGGASGIDGKSGKLQFNIWSDSIYYYAKAYGYTGAKLTPNTDIANEQHVSYLDGQVQAYVYEKDGHGGVGMTAAAEAFLGAANTVPATPAPAPAPGPSTPAPSGGAPGACSAECEKEYANCVEWMTKRNKKDPTSECDADLAEGKRKTGKICKEHGPWPCTISALQWYE